MTPAINLAVAAALFVTLVILLRPRGGWLWKWLRGRRATERVRIEDALKHLYDCEYGRVAATPDSLAGALQIGRDEAARLTARLETLGLLVADQRGLKLTAEGCGYALRVIRIHRLWEVTWPIAPASARPNGTSGRTAGAHDDGGRGGSDCRPSWATPFRSARRSDPHGRRRDAGPTRLAAVRAESRRGRAGSSTSKTSRTRSTPSWSRPGCRRE